MTGREKGIVTVAAVLLVAFAGYAGWQAAQAGSCRDALAVVRADLALQRHESTLALTAIEATRGSFELARQLASGFFTGLQADVVDAPAAAREPLRRILAERDAIITALSRSDPQVVPLLVQLLIRYRTALGEPVGPGTPAASPPVSDTTGT